jgi:hypothetical protein
MSKKALKALLITWTLIVSFVVFCENSEACFSIEVTVEDSNNNVDRGKYTLYDIEISLRPGCKSTYWISFLDPEGVPVDWSTAILNESGGVVPYNYELVYSGIVTVYFYLKVKARDSAGGDEIAWITSYIRATDYYNQDDTLDFSTTTKVNAFNQAPTPVTLTQAENTTNSIKLEWTQNNDPDFDRYEVHLGSFNDFTPVSGTLIATIDDQGTTEYNVTGLSAGSTYYFIIRVWDYDSILLESHFSDSNLLIAYTPGINYPPVAVVLDDPTYVTNRSAVLSWTQNLDYDFDRYEIHGSHSLGFIPSQATRIVDPIYDQNVILYNVDGLDENTTNYFKIRVWDTGNLFNDSNEVNCHTEDHVPLSCELYDPYDTTPSSTKLNWSQNCNSDFDRYEVHMSQTPGFTPGPETLVESFNNTKDNFTTIYALDDQMTYYFKVQVWDKAGHHADSNEVVVTTPDGTKPRIIITAPYDTEIEIEPTTEIVVTFSEPMNTNTVTFTCSPDPDGWSEIWSNSDQTVTYSHNDFDSNTLYTFQITGGQDMAGNSLGGADVPNPWTFRTKDFIAPEITSTSPEDSDIDVAIDIKISITFSEEMDHQSVEDAIDTTILYGAPTWNGNTITLTPTSDLSYSIQYIVTITKDAKDLAGNKIANSFTFSFTTEEEPTEPPGPINHDPVVSVSSPSSDISDHTFTIEWSATDVDDDPLTIDLYYDNDKDTGNGMILIESGVSNSGSYVWDTSDLSEGNYYVYVTANDGTVEIGSYSGRLTIDHPEEVDTDDDGIPDTLDTDDDDDGLLDIEEDIDQDGNLDDGETDPLDPDTDGDGYDDMDDDFPQDPLRWSTDIGDDKDTGDSADFPLILFVIILCAILIVVLVGAWALSSSKKSIMPRGLINCPQCGQTFQPDPSTGPYVRCPYCGTSGRLR